jgi:(p)ppGpp synthase/HD superfamily hydrolase
VFEVVSLRSVNLASDARAFAVEAYGTDSELAHPTEVATLVGSDDEELWAAAILHDLVEDTDVEIPDIAARFGSRVAALVAAMTEDGSISKYQARKEEHRQRARDAGRDAALLFVADKLSNARRMQRGQKEPEPKKLAHYRATLDTMRRAYPDLPLLDELSAELAVIGPAQPSAPAPRPGARA